MAESRSSATVCRPEAIARSRPRQPVASLGRFASGRVVPFAGRCTPGRAGRGAMARSTRAFRAKEDEHRMTGRSLGLLLCLLLGLPGLLACSSTQAKEADYGARSRAASADTGFAPAMMSESGSPAPAQRVIIRTGSIVVEVPDLAIASAQLEARVDALGGYVEDSTATEEMIHLAARVPSAQLDAFLDEAAALGEERSRSVSGRDVTEEYADIGAELDNLLALRDRLRALLDKAQNVEEILKVERELTRVQTRIDSLTGRKERIEKDVALSMVSVTLQKKPEPRILGPLGLLYEGGKWLAIKLFVISP